jgi:hypothetical protein
VIASLHGMRADYEYESKNLDTNAGQHEGGSWRPRQ